MRLLRSNLIRVLSGWMVRRQELGKHIIEIVFLLLGFCNILAVKPQGRRLADE